MVKIDQHISTLLYRYDCVIVPDFGGFVANYAPARIHPVQHTFSPPFKNIIFNKNLRNNDGLLANHIAHKEKTTYTEANKIIGKYVSDCNDNLKKGAKVTIEKVGTLSLNVERNVQFEPDNTVNYLIESFGLTTFQSPAIKRDGHIRQLEKEFKDRIIPKPHPKKKINIKRYVALALTIPVALGIMWISLKTDLLKNVNYSNLNPFVEREKPVYTERDNESSFIFTETELKPNISLLPNDDTTSFVNISLIEGAANSITVKLNEEASILEAKADKTNVVSNRAGGKMYHIVAGCFRIAENAHNFVLQLKGKNMDAAIIGKNENGLYIVSIGNYPTRGEALKEIAQIRPVNPEIWLLKK